MFVNFIIGFRIIISTNRIGYGQSVECSFATKTIHYKGIEQITSYTTQADYGPNPRCLININHKIKWGLLLRLQLGQHGRQPTQSYAMTVDNECGYKK